jgi:hypothetical protein
VVSTPSDLFVSHPGRDYHLTIGSAGIESGTPSPDAPTDADGISRPLDSDNNGSAIWDIGAFEVIHATANTDGDPMPDSDEAIAGTDLTNAASFFILGSHTAASNAPLTLTWLSAPGRTYTLACATNISGATSVIDSNIVATPPMNTYTVNTAAASQRHYSLRVRK